MGMKVSVAKDNTIKLKIHNSNDSIINILWINMKIK